jgi:TetR/AcrR family transcriptional regulator of autoinduction and epiphytic fitness
MRKGEIPRERGEQTRARIADALVDLLRETELPPTAKQVAARAGVSVRLVFHHFEDMEALYRAVARAQFDRHWRGLGPVPSGLTLGQRIDRTVLQRARLFDAVAPVRRQAAVLAVRHRDVAQSIELTDKLLRGWLDETFSDELQAAGGERRELLAALEAAASWETWDRLRRAQGLSAVAARRVVARTLRALLDA